MRANSQEIVYTALTLYRGKYLSISSAEGSMMLVRNEATSIDLGLNIGY